MISNTTRAARDNMRERLTDYDFMRRDDYSSFVRRTPCTAHIQLRQRYKTTTKSHISNTIKFQRKPKTQPKRQKEKEGRVLTRSTSLNNSIDPLTPNTTNIHIQMLQS
jgi:hypothetical protein